MILRLAVVASTLLVVFGVGAGLAQLVGWLAQ